MPSARGAPFPAAGAASCSHDSWRVPNAAVCPQNSHPGVSYLGTLGMFRSVIGNVLCL